MNQASLSLSIYDSLCGAAEKPEDYLKDLKGIVEWIKFINMKVSNFLFDSLGTGKTLIFLSNKLACDKIVLSNGTVNL